MIVFIYTVSQTPKETHFIIILEAKIKIEAKIISQTQPKCLQNQNQNFSFGESVKK